MGVVKRQLTVVTANIGRGEDKAKCEDNLRRIRRTFPGALIGFQEIDEADGPDEHAILRSVFHDYTFAGWGTFEPIAVPPGWHIRRERVDKACDGLARATPTRWVVQALIVPEDGSLPPLVDENGHYNLPRLDGVGRRGDGQRRWNDCQSEWTVRTGHWHVRGLTVLTQRDTNHHGVMPKLHADEEQLLDPTAIDKVSVIPAAASSDLAVHVKVVGRRSANLNIDGHNAEGVDLELTTTAALP